MRGGMYWHAGPPSSPESKYLVRTTPAGAETSLGSRTPENEAIFERFTQRKRESTERVSGLKAALEQHQRLNRALRVGRVDPLVVALLGRLASTQLSPHFRVVGTHALYAYEVAAGVRLDSDTLATRDMDLLWDTRKRILFSTQLAKVDSSMLGVLKKVDSTFRIRQSQKYTAPEPESDNGYARPSYAALMNGLAASRSAMELIVTSRLPAPVSDVGHIACFWQHCQRCGRIHMQIQHQAILLVQHHGGKVL